MPTVDFPCVEPRNVRHVRASTARDVVEQLDAWRAEIGPAAGLIHVSGDCREDECRESPLETFDRLVMNDSQTLLEILHSRALQDANWTALVTVQSDSPIGRLPALGATTSLSDALASWLAQVRSGRFLSLRVDATAAAVSAYQRFLESGAETRD